MMMLIDDDDAMMMKRCLRHLHCTVLYCHKLFAVALLSSLWVVEGHYFLDYQGITYHVIDKSVLPL